MKGLGWDEYSRMGSRMQRVKTTVLSNKSELW
jgi:hypothetical protein